VLESRVVISYSLGYLCYTFTILEYTLSLYVESQYCVCQPRPHSQISLDASEHRTGGSFLTVPGKHQSCLIVHRTSKDICGTNIKYASLTRYVTNLLFLMFCAPFRYRYLVKMENRTKNLSVTLADLEERPFPLASSTAVEWYCDSYCVCDVYYVM
jgi:hypothetical protein